MYKKFLEKTNLEDVNNKELIEKVQKLQERVKKLEDQFDDLNNDEKYEVKNFIKSEGSIIKNIIEQIAKLEDKDGSYKMFNFYLRNLDISDIKFDILEESLEK